MRPRVFAFASALSALHIHADAQASPILAVFNLTNVQRSTARYQVYNTSSTRANNQPPYTTPSSPLFGKDFAWQRPRLIQLGLRVGF